MLRGIDSPTDVSESLSISNTAKSYIQLIQERWTSYSSVDELQAKSRNLLEELKKSSKRRGYFVILPRIT